MSAILRDLKPVIRLFITERRRMLFVGAGLAAVTVLAGVALLGLSGWFITATALAGLTATTAMAFDVFAPAAGIRFLALLRTGARYGERLTTHDATLSVLAALRERLFRGWAGPRAARALALRPAKLLFRLTADIDALDGLYLRVLVPVGAMVAAAIGTAVATGFIAPWLGVSVGVWLLAAGLGIPLVAARMAYRPARRRAQAVEMLRAGAIDLVAGQTELVMVGRLNAQRDHLAAIDSRLTAADDRLNRIEAGVTVGYGLASALALAGMLLAVAALAEAGTIGAPVAALGILIVLAAVEPFGALRRGALEFGRTLLAARRLAPRLLRQAAPVEPAAARQGLAVQLIGVDARHEGAARATLRDIDLIVARGERVAIVGASGAGKSTLLALLSGELLPERGEAVAVPTTLMTQRTELFQDSLRDNLRLAAPAAPDGELMRVLDAAGLGVDVAALPQGLDTPLGEGGLGLSGGQSRRLALARLFLRDTPLWLLDEPTEGLDGATARDVLIRLGREAGERALVIATHIRREAEVADRVIVMEQGQIVAVMHRGEPDFDAVLAALRPD
ncbi:MULTISPECIES: amino acid ABC transporter ATP-binding/permease protein [unclassified Chelatococcus]|uniref:amino acid ABC transporter ATP-binding/permease protein n=1 Tax=unclassified Chelatococcus TaxID=2638111 RepID=UPI001BD0C890|nr:MULTISPECIES: amino acid ABC transporter ATP-binding/permease protein [unclassified Chelatococcus]CAH1668601.1 Transport ATP-binding protein CydC [Hyphomicrobiales bacterium]MBS7739437.1 amino acid ABC transporter ATP-binding/permease protein [Chelatococcus sp. HY11]MBX3543806.1 amino acid ABC transporter ATP-binding/permease protein [Chelatococcus sp.]MCO5076027.1 amino acid ABC transporter ATP-binding/permease protein [Chelatococcus sp.]CAH1679935.1 Transport ATP-binding protein CydC [Hyp